MSEPTGMSASRDAIEAALRAEDAINAAKKSSSRKPKPRRKS